MKILRAYKTELDPNDKQRTAFRRAAGCARWAYDWGLRKKKDAYIARKKAIASGVSKTDAPPVPSAIDLHKELNLLKKVPVEDGGVPWMYQVSKTAPQQALRNLDKAFDNFFRRCKSKVEEKGFPKFKSKKKRLGSFHLQASATRTHAILPRIGKVKLKERGYLPTKNAKNVRILDATASEKAGRWFLSLQVEEEMSDPTNRSYLPIIGVDVGIKTLATCSDGMVFSNPKALKTGEARLRLLQKSFNRKRKGSANRRRANRKVARQHYRISCIRKDALHKTSNAITKYCSTVVLEDLNVAGMMKNHKLAKAVSDTSMSELIRQIRYKAAWRGVKVLTADRWFPSSKTCSRCGKIKTELLLSEREFVCESLNAAINLRNLTESSSVTACGEISSGVRRKVERETSLCEAGT